MKLADRLDNLRPSAIGEVFDLARRLRAEGRDIVDLSTGEPDFETDADVKKAGHQAITDGVTRYTECDGTVEIKQAVCRKFARDNNLSFTPDQIVVGSGAKPLLGQLMMALLNEGDEVIIPTPCWSSHVGMSEALGAVPVLLETAMADGFVLKPGKLEKAINDRARLLVLCSPSNPTGSVYSAEDLKALADVLRKHPDIWILSDDIYEKIMFDQKPFVSLANVAPDLIERTVIVNGVSKSHAMTGWRIGYAAGSTALMNGMRRLLSHVGGSPCSISQAAAITALDGPQDAVQHRCLEYQRRRDAVLQALSGVRGLRPFKASGAFYLFVDCGDLLGSTTPAGEVINSSADLARYLLEAAGVAIVPGAAFYADPYFRMSIANSLAELQSGCERIGQAILELRPN